VLKHGCVLIYQRKRPGDFLGYLHLASPVLETIVLWLVRTARSLYLLV
jgi:hypothetical protein